MVARVCVLVAVFLCVNFARGQQFAGPARISGGVMAGQLLNKVTPVYPPIARAAHVSGAVVLHAIISKDGTVGNLEAISGPEMLRVSALDAVRQWTYQPYLLNGEPTEVDTTVIVNFNFGAPPPSLPLPTADETDPDQPRSPAPTASMSGGAALGQPPLMASSALSAVRVSGGVMAAQLLTHVNPTYPAEARAQGLSGTVVLRALVGKDGTIDQLSAISGPEVFRPSAINAVQGWTYRPYLLNGNPTAVETTIVVNFTAGTP